MGRSIWAGQSLVLCGPGLTRADLLPPDLQHKWRGSLVHADRETDGAACRLLLRYSPGQVKMWARSKRPVMSRWTSPMVKRHSMSRALTSATHYRSRDHRPSIEAEHGIDGKLREQKTTNPFGYLHISGPTIMYPGQHASSLAYTRPTDAHAGRPAAANHDCGEIDIPAA